MLGIAIGGIGVLIALGVLIGRALDRRAQDDAWRRIAAARRANDAWARRLGVQPGETDDALDAPDPPTGRPSAVRLAGRPRGGPGSVA